MNKAFIFDMDGVLIDTEHIWAKYDDLLLTEFAGPEIAKLIGRTVGWSVNIIYDKAIALGASFDRDEFLHRYHELAPRVYAEAPVTPGVELLVDELTRKKYRIGIVSSSERAWIEYALKRFPFGGTFETIVSLNDNPSLKHKPSPDGYLASFKNLEADPKQSFVIEDSNPGIAAGKASGAFVIGFRQLLLDDYEQTGADVYVDTMAEVQTLIADK